MFNLKLGAIRYSNFHAKPPFFKTILKVIKNQMKYLLILDISIYTENTRKYGLPPFEKDLTTASLVNTLKQISKFLFFLIQATINVWESLKLQGSI